MGQLDEGGVTQEAGQMLSSAAMVLRKDRCTGGGGGGADQKMSGTI